MAVLFPLQVPWPGAQGAAAQSRKAVTKPAAKKRHTVLIKDMKYQPSVLTVKVGTQ